MLIGRVATAQEGHYWTVQFGTKSTFLGGAVVGSAVDASANFYNPGAVSMLEDEINFQGTAVYLWESLKFENDLPGIETEGFSEIKSVPNFLGGVLDINILGTVRIGYSIFGRHSYKLELASSLSDTLNAIDRFGTPQKFTGRAVRTIEVRDDWYGMTFAYRPAPKIGFGFSPFLSVRTLDRTRESIRADVLHSPDQNATTWLNRDYSYNIYSILLKMGIYYDGKPISLGMAITTPGIRIKGNGSIHASATVFNQDQNGDGELDTVLSTIDVKDQEAQYKTPLAVSIGAAWRANTRTVYLSAEWFNRISPYHPIEAGPDVTKFNGNALVPEFFIESKSVVNIAVGLEQRLNARTMLYLSALTDFSAIASGNDAFSSMADRDLFNVTAGTSVTISRFTVTAGLGFVYGREKSDERVNFLNPHESNYLLGEPAFEKVRYRGLKMIIGLELAPAASKEK